MSCATRIDPDTRTRQLHLPDGQAAHEVLRTELQGPSDHGIYHREAVLHMHEDGSGVLPLNTAGWALACAWRGQVLPYGLYGPIVVTGPEDDRGGMQPLAQHLADEVCAVAAAVRAVHGRWRMRTPSSEQAAQSELVDAACRAIGRPR